MPSILSLLIQVIQHAITTRIWHVKEKKNKINESTEVLNPRRYAWMSNIVLFFVLSCSNSQTVCPSKTIFI